VGVLRDDTAAGTVAARSRSLGAPHARCRSPR
jgi:hypothetical protein